MVFELDKILSPLKKWAQSKPEIMELWIFGSVVKGKSNPNDLDLCIIDNTFSIGYDGSIPLDDWQIEISNILQLPVDLQIGFHNDNIVWPAVLDHGLKIYP